MFVVMENGVSVFSFELGERDKSSLDQGNSSIVLDKTILSDVYTQSWKEDRNGILFLRKSSSGGQMTIDKGITTTKPAFIHEDRIPL